MTPIPLSCPERVTATATTAQIVTMTENRKKTRAAGHHGAGVGGPNPSTMRRLSAPPGGDASRMRASPDVAAGDLRGVHPGGHRGRKAPVPDRALVHCAAGARREQGSDPFSLRVSIAARLGCH